MRRTTLVITALLLAAGAALLIGRKAPPPPSGSPPAVIAQAEPMRQGPKFSPDEQALAYRIEQHSSSRIDPSRFIAAEGPLSVPDGVVASRSGFSGELHLRFLLKDSSGWVVAARLAGLHLDIDGRTPPFAGALDEPFSFDFRPNGVIDNFQFVQGLPETSQEWIADVIRETQVVLPSAEKGVWTTRELRTYGALSARYELLSAQPLPILTKTTIEIENRQESPAFNPAIRTQVVFSESRITLGEGWRRVREIEKKEEVNYLEGASKVGTAAMSFRLALVGPSEFELPDSQEGLRAALSDRTYLEKTFYEPEEISVGRKEDPGAEAALAVYARLLGDSQEDALIYLRNYLKLHPMRSYEILTLAEDSSLQLDTTAKLIAWRAVAEAGHAEAQEALVAFFTENGRPDAQRMRAIAYLHSLTNPTARTVDDTLLFLQRGLGSPTLSDEVKVMAIYAYGALANTPHIAQEVRETIYPNLASLTQQYRESDLLVPLIHAMGNHRGEEVVAALRPFSFDANESVRAAALESLAKAGGDEAFKAFASAMEGEKSSSVRIRAVQSLSESSTRSEVNRWVAAQIDHTVSGREREAMIEILGKGLQQHPVNEDTLRRLLGTPLTNQEKKAIYKYISP